jgi:regulatory protein
MTVTEIKRLKSGRYGLFSDGKFIISLDERVYLDSGVANGCELDEEQLGELRAADEKRRAAEKALTLLTARDHSGAELRQKLKRTLSAEAAEDAAGRMEELGLINDEKFAQELAGELYSRRLLGRGRVLIELKKRGVAKDIAEAAADELDDDPGARALELLRRKYPRGIADEAGRRRALALLARSGYGWDECRGALKEFANNDETDEQDAY